MQPFFRKPCRCSECQLKKDAKLSACRNYRFALWRIWDETKPCVMFVGLNPSTADETEDDPTLTRCINYAKAWGYGGVCMANLFAFRATAPASMMSAKDPVGSENDHWLKQLSQGAAIVVAAWGNDGCYLGRSGEVKSLLNDLHCLRMNKSGEPAHPLYLKTDLRPMPMSKN